GADGEALLQKELRGDASSGACGAGDEDGGGGHIGGASWRYYLPWISRPRGASGPTGMRSYFAKPPVTSGSVSSSAFACSTESAFMRKITPGASWRYQNCSILPSR